MPIPFERNVDLRPSEYPTFKIFQVVIASIWTSDREISNSELGKWY
jgi:hypothetical protein